MCNPTGNTDLAGGTCGQNKDDGCVCSCFKEDIIQCPGLGLCELMAKLSCNVLLGRKQQILLPELLDQQQLCE
jgi:hypothetical protein